MSSTWIESLYTGQMAELTKDAKHENLATHPMSSGSKDMKDAWFLIIELPSYKDPISLCDGLYEQFVFLFTVSQGILFMSRKAMSSH